MPIQQHLFKPVRRRIQGIGAAALCAALVPGCGSGTIGTETAGAANDSGATRDDGPGTAQGEAASVGPDGQAAIDGAALSVDAPASAPVDCTPTSTTVTFAYDDPSIPSSRRGNNGSFSDSCDTTGNLVKYSCEAMSVCGPSPGPNPGCTFSNTGSVKSWAIDCAGHCSGGACPSRCPAFGDKISVESVVGAGGVVVVDQTDGRHFACTLSFDNPNDAFDCVSGVHVGSAGNMVAQGFRGNWCTGGDIGGWGVCYDGGASCNVENCSYTCTVPR